MPDPSPDTPSVCPACDGVHVDVVSAIHQFCNADWSDDGFNDWAEDLATEILSVMHATPAAPGSPTPDTAALVAELRDITSEWRYRSDDRGWAAGRCSPAADALEAQAARITELEAAMADHTLTTPTEETE